MSFAPGDEVVCVRCNDTKNTIDYGRMDAAGYSYPKLHQHYTVREVRTNCEGESLLFVEIVNPPLRTRLGRLEIAWVSNCFRSVRRESIEVFRQMCISKPLVKG